MQILLVRHTPLLRFLELLEILDMTLDSTNGTIGVHSILVNIRLSLLLFNQPVIHMRTRSRLLPRQANKAQLYHLSQRVHGMLMSLWLHLLTYWISRDKEMIPLILR